MDGLAWGHEHLESWWADNARPRYSSMPRGLPSTFPFQKPAASYSSVSERPRIGHRVAISQEMVPASKPIAAPPTTSMGQWAPM